MRGFFRVGVGALAAIGGALCLQLATVRVVAGGDWPDVLILAWLVSVIAAGAISAFGGGRSR